MRLLLQEIGPELGQGFLAAGARSFRVIVAVDTRRAGRAVERRKRCAQSLAA